MRLSWSTVCLSSLLVCAAACSKPEAGPSASSASARAQGSSSASTTAKAPASEASATPPPSASQPAPSTQPASVHGLRLELVPIAAGLARVTPVDPKGAPVATPLVVRVTNESKAVVHLRTGGDDESFALRLRGPGAKEQKHEAPCPEIHMMGKVHSIEPGAHVDIPLGNLTSGQRCADTSHYMTTAGDYELDIELRAHVMPDASVDGKGEPITLAAPTVNLRAG